MKPDDESLPKALPVDAILNAPVPEEQGMPEEERVLRRIVKRATNASAVLDSIVNQWNSSRHGGNNE